MMWRLVWPLWLLLLAVSFGVLEGYALVHDQQTLSAWVWTLAAAWPPIVFVAGFVAGFLACHFFWPNQGLKQKD